MDEDTTTNTCPFQGIDDVTLHFYLAQLRQRAERSRPRMERWQVIKEIKELQIHLGDSPKKESK